MAGDLLFLKLNKIKAFNYYISFPYILDKSYQKNKIKDFL